MKYIKNFENGNITPDTHYVWYHIKNNGKEEQFELNKDLYTYDNYDLDSMVDAYIKVKGEKRGIKIKKVTVEDVDLYKVPRYVLKKDTDKYNL